MNKLCYYYPIMLKNDNIEYNYNINISNINNLHSINERYDEKNSLTIYKIFNSYRISLVLKYIIVKMLENLKENQNTNDINDLFLKNVKNIDTNYKYTYDDIREVLDFKEADEDDKRKKKYEELGSDRQRLQQMYRGFNIGDKYSEMDLNYTNNQDVENIEQINRQDYMDETITRDNSLFIESNMDEINETSLMNTNNDQDGDGNNDEFEI